MRGISSSDPNVVAEAKEGDADKNDSTGEQLALELLASSSPLAVSTDKYCLWWRCRRSGF